MKRFYSSDSFLRRNYKNFNAETFSKDIKRIFENSFEKCTSINDKFELLNNTILKAIDKNAPFRKLTKREKNAGYEQKHLYFLIQRRNRSDLIEQYENFKKQLEHDLKKAKKDFYDAAFLEHRNDIKETWKLINNAINKKK